MIRIKKTVVFLRELKNSCAAIEKLAEGGTAVNLYWDDTHLCFGINDGQFCDREQELKP